MTAGVRPSIDRVPLTERRRPNPLRTTPGRLRLLAGASVAAVLALLAVFAVAVGDAHNGLKRIGHHDGPIVVATSNLYFALADMDAQVANVLLVGERKDLGITADDALKIYEQRRAEVAGYIQRTGAIAGDSPEIGAELRPLLIALGRYEGLAAQAILANRGNRVATAGPSNGQPPAAGTPSGAALDLYREATHVMHADLLPVAKRLTDRSASLVAHHYASAQSATTGAVAIVAVLGLLLLTLLGGLQLFLVRRHRRMLNPAAALATVAALFLLVSGMNALAQSMGNLKAAAKDTFDTIVVLQQARAVSCDANADKSRYLLDPGHGYAYEIAFAEKSQRLVDTGTGTSVSGYDTELERLLSNYARPGAKATFGGYYGTALRNADPAERDAASTMLERYREYQLADRKMRGLVAAGDRNEAIRFATSLSPSDSNGRFDTYDQALLAYIDINARAFARLVNDGDSRLSRWNWLPEVVLIPVAVLVLLGVRPRLAEYRP